MAEWASFGRGTAECEINATEAGTTSPGVSLNCARRRLGRLVGSYGYYERCKLEGHPL